MKRALRRDALDRLQRRGVLVELGAATRADLEIGERLENRRYTSTIKTYFRRLRAAVEAGDDATADADHRELVSLIDKAVKTGALHRNNGARKKSRAARVRQGEQTS